MQPESSATNALAPIRVSGSYWIELSPVLVAANTFYPVQIPEAKAASSESPPAKRI